MTGSKDCVLGAEIAMSEDTVGLKAAYGVFKQEALAVEGSYNPLSINLEGWKATNQAWAILYNFTPFSERVQKRKENPKKSTRFEQYNGFVYHKNWLHNLLIADSLNAHNAAT